MKANSWKVVFLGLALMAVAVYVGAGLVEAAESPFPEPAKGTDLRPGKAKAVFAGGCFWCTEAVFEPLAGVDRVVSGYSGGDARSARYDLVSAGQTSHAESIEITFDTSRISYGQLLKIFFSVAHDPTQLNRQGPDWGKQYRSAIFYVNEDQRQAAESYIRQLQEAKVFSKPIVTEVKPLQAFYAAEGYHQDFVKLNPQHPYVMANALPKLNKLKKLYADLLVSRRK